MLICYNVFFFSVPRYKNIIQLWAGCPPPGMWSGEGCLVIIWRTEMVCTLISYLPSPILTYTNTNTHTHTTCGQQSWPSLPLHYCSCTQHIVISHCKHQSPLSQLDYLLYRCHQRSGVKTDSVSCWITLMEDWLSYGFAIPVKCVHCSKVNKKKGESIFV